MPNPNYVVGRGKLYFDKFLAGTKTVSGNERYLGNAPEISLTQSEETLDHYASTGGVNVKDASVSLQNDMSGSFTLDDIMSENLALWFRGEAQANAVAAVTDGTTVATIAALGTYVQLGLTPGNPMGARNVSSVTAVIDAGGANTAVDAAGNFEVDAATGRVYILEDADDISVDDEITFTFDAAIGTEDIVIGSGETVEGRLVFIADNPAGDNRDYVWPYVKLSPDGDLALIGDDWQTMSFSFEVLKLNSTTERQYISKR